MTKHTSSSRKSGGNVFQTGTSRLVFAYCCSLVFFIAAIAASYAILQNTIETQKNLTRFNFHIHSMQLALTDSIGVVNDYQLESKKNNPNPRLKNIIKRRVRTSKEQLEDIGRNLQISSMAFEQAVLWPEINWIVIDEENSLTHKLDSYTSQIKSLLDRSNDTINTRPRVPIEAAGARTGVLFEGYQKASEQLQLLVDESSSRVEAVHKFLTTFIIVVVLLISALVVVPLWIRLISEHRRLESAHKRLYKIAYTDRDTGLLNLEGLEKKLTELPSLQNSDAGFYLMLVRIRNLDQIYNLIGTHSADVLFRAFTSRLQDFKNCPAKWCRSGEAEFACLIPEAQMAQAGDYIKNLHALLTERLIVDNTGVRPEVNLAASRIEKEELVCVNPLWKHVANARLAAADFDPPEIWLPIYHADMNNALADQNTLVDDITTGLSEKQFVPFYQLKVDAQSGTASSIEALARWKKSDGRFESPGVFIPVAESTGLIVEMTFAIFDQVLADIQDWCAAGIRVERVAINLARDVLLHDELTPRLKHMVENLPESCEGLEMEITENIAIGDHLERTSAILAEIRQLGIHVAIDDFGTGYASLQTLIDMPFDVLKIDRSFVIPMTEDGEGNEVVSAMISLSKKLGKNCVVEGVETDWQWRLLAEMGANELQGFYFHKPTSATETKEKMGIAGDNEWRSAA